MTSLIEDKFAIEERIALYNQSLDEGRYADFLSCWCDDGVFDGLDGPHVGQAAIKAFTDRYDDRYRLRLNGLRHFTVNILSQIDGDVARSNSHLQLVCTGSKGAHILFTGRYEDELRRVNGQWLFSRRRLAQDLPRTAPATTPTPQP